GLLVGVIFIGLRRPFDRRVKAVERFEKLIAREVTSSNGADDFFYFRCDDVALQEFIILKNFAEDSFGKQVLDEHFLNCGGVEMRVDRLPTKFGKGLEFITEIRVSKVLFVEQVGKVFSKIRYL